MTHHPAMIELVDILCHKTQNTDRAFYQAEVAYFLGKIASNQRVVIATEDRGEIPVNIYSIGLSPSGFGKGFSVNIMEELLEGYRKEFVEVTLPTIAEANLKKLSLDKANKSNTDSQVEYDNLMKSYKLTGAYPFTFDSGTTPAVKQLRSKLLLANCGAINLQIDEIGSNLLASVDVLTLFLELYDQGKVKSKITKSTTENLRSEELEGKTPANVLLFGTPSKLFDGASLEDLFYSFLETGYARRFIFGVGTHNKKAYLTKTVEQIYDNLTDKSDQVMISKWYTHFEELANVKYHNTVIKLNRAEGIQLLSYKIECEKLSDLLPEHSEIKRAELSHRYFKALKLAGAYAFIDKSITITKEHLEQAIFLVEESGNSFQSILNREKPYVKLAKYLSAEPEALTHADLTEALPFYKSSNVLRSELMSLATAWGYKHNVIIKKSFIDGIEFFKGESLKETNLSELIISFSNDFAYNYEPYLVGFSNLHLMTQEEGHHWSNHHFINNHRAEANTKVGFNVLVLDIDEGTSLELCHTLLEEYTFMTYTTKRHSEECNRYRVLIPINYTLKLSSDEYKELVNSLFGFLPFASIDSSCNQRAKKWETFKGNYFYNEGVLFDILPFIPATSKNIEFKKEVKNLSSDNIERWFAQKIAIGNRNNNLLKFALLLKDSGLSYESVIDKVTKFNNKLNNPLDSREIEFTIFSTLFKRYQNDGRE